MPTVKSAPKVDSKTQALRDSTILAQLDEKRNGVRFGTLLVLGICETTEEALSFDPMYMSRARELDARIYGEFSVPRD